MIVIPMAGLSRRFTEAGYDRPKYRLMLQGRSLFAHAVDSFRAYFATEPFLFIAREEMGVTAFIAEELATLGVAGASTVLLPAPTKGQADTVRLGLREGSVPPDTPITIFNIDTFRPGFLHPGTPWMDHADGYLEVMRGSDPGFSYVLPMGEGADQRVAETAEKKVISPFASTGLYWFRRVGDFLTALEQDEAGAYASGELYVAPLYNALVGRGFDIRFQEVPVEAVVFCGTPSQYQHLLATRSQASPP